MVCTVLRRRLHFNENARNPFINNPRTRSYPQKNAQQNKLQLFFHYSIFGQKYLIVLLHRCNRNKKNQQENVDNFHGFIIHKQIDSFNVFL